MADHYAQYRAVRFFGSLDGLRAFSIMGVVWFHSWWGTPYYPILAKLPVLRLGEYGVQMFYVVSGFLITTLLLRERDRFGQFSLRDFYIRRTLRIWPLYYSVVVLYIFVVLVFERDPRRSASFFHYLPSFLTYTYPWFLVPKWPGGIFNLAGTLAVEEQFYAFWPVVNRLLRGFGASAVMAGLLVLRTAAGYGYLGKWLPPDSFLARVVLSIAIPICLGAILAHALHSEKIFAFLFPVLGKKWMAPLTGSVLLLSLAPKPVYSWLTWTANILFVAACVMREDHGLAWLLRFRPLAYIGVVSYGMYLLNSLSIHLVQAILGRLGLLHPALAFPFSLAVTVGVATISYRYFETPFLEWKKKRFSPMAKAQPTTSAPAEVAAAPKEVLAS